MVFTTLAHHMDETFLMEAFRHLRKDAAAGIDEVTASDYAVSLGANIQDLYQRLVTKQYRAQPARRTYVPKDDGTLRPLAILVLEDKIVQKAVTMLLEAVYEPMFYSFSYGFRHERSPHQALKFLRDQCLRLGIRWIIDADIKGYFDSINQKLLREILQRRVNDGTLIRLLGKWLHVGVLEAEGEILRSSIGAPQGAVISPMLSNIFLHTVLDEWFEHTVRPRMKGRCFLVRFADDFVLGFECEEDAQRVYEVLPKRFARYDLTIHPTKSRLVDFGCPRSWESKGNGSFDFLGFTHYWSRTRSGHWTIKRKTRAKRIRRTLRALWLWCRKNRHKPVSDQHQKLCQKLQGHYQYFAVRGNYKMLEVVYKQAECAWRYWLNQRSSKKSVTWDVFERRFRRVFPLPKPRIIHAF
jgi:group II intron reverse transcriptase/maturase